MDEVTKSGYDYIHTSEVVEVSPLDTTQICAGADMEEEVIKKVNIKRRAIYDL